MKKGIKVIIVFALAIALMGSGFWLVHRFIESKEQQESFRKLGESVLFERPAVPVKTVPNQDSSRAPGNDEKPERNGPEVLHDMAALKEKNTDCVGWLWVPDTANRLPSYVDPRRPGEIPAPGFLRRLV